MPPLPITGGPKVVLYHQTHHTPAGEPVSVLPLLRRDSATGATNPSVTHVIVGAIHLNADPAAPTLNDHHPDHARFDVLWAEVRALQQAGVRVLGMLGGAAKGTYARLDVGAPENVAADLFETHYATLQKLVRRRRLDGLDLDVEERMSLVGIVYLIDRLRRDFGPGFLITMAPVAAALLYPSDSRANLSGFSYADVEQQRGHEIAWYHAQFYCGWGDAQSPQMYLSMTSSGSRAIPGLGPHRVLMGLLTNPANGSGWVDLELTTSVLLDLCAAAQQDATYFAGVSGWEYFNALPGGKDCPWEWPEWMSAVLGSSVKVANVGQGRVAAEAVKTAATAATVATAEAEADPDDEAGPPAPVPHPFEYEYESDAQD